MDGLLARLTSPSDSLAKALGIHFSHPPAPWHGPLRYRNIQL